MYKFTKLHISVFKLDRLYSSAVYNDDLEKFSLAEIVRRPVDDLVLQMKVSKESRTIISKHLQEEVVFNDFKAGALGPGTIIGSAAFNLMCITGICILSIPGEDTRRIDKFKVFLVTAVFSLVAYLWILVVLVAITPDYVDVWEAIVTFIFFPIMVVIAYMVDKDYCGKGSVQDAGLEMGKCIYKSDLMVPRVL